MAIVRLRELGPQEATVATSTHHSSTVLYTFLKSTASTHDRAVAMREFLRSQARSSGVAHGGGGGALLSSSNAKLVSLCEEVVLDRLLLGSQHLQRDQTHLAAAQRQERSPSLAMEKGFWKRFLTTAAASTAGGFESANASHAATLAVETEIVPIRTRRRPPARKEASDPVPAADHPSDAFAAGHAVAKQGVSAAASTQSGDVAASVSEMPATTDFIRAGSASSPTTNVERKGPRRDEGSEPRIASLPKASPNASSTTTADGKHGNGTTVSTPIVRVDHHSHATPMPSGDRHRRERSQPNNALPSLLARALGSLAERLDADPNASDPADESADAERARLHRSLVDVRTRVKSLAEQSQRRLMLLHPPRRASGTPLSGGGGGPAQATVAFLDEMSTRIDNVESLLRVEDHEQDTLDLTANALRLENAALTRMLRSVLAIMMRHELRLDNAVVASARRGGVDGEASGNFVSEGEQELLSELRNILDDASAEE